MISTHTHARTHDPFSPLGERQKLITFPVTAEQSHILIFNTPPFGVSLHPAPSQPAHGQQEKEVTTRLGTMYIPSYRTVIILRSSRGSAKKKTDSNFSLTLASTEEGRRKKKNNNRGQTAAIARALARICQAYGVRALLSRI